MQKVYVEFVLLDNFLMDFLLLYLALRFSEKKARLGRVCGGAALGAVYAAAAVALPFLQSFPCKLLVSLLMLLCARTWKPWKNFLRTAALFYAATFLFGGACFAAMYFFSRETYSGAFINLPVLRYLLLGGTAAVAFSSNTCPAATIPGSRQPIICPPLSPEKPSIWMLFWIQATTCGIFPAEASSLPARMRCFRRSRRLSKASSAWKNGNPPAPRGCASCFFLWKPFREKECWFPSFPILSF